MVAGVSRLVALVAIVAAPLVASAQPIPPSEQPGRERERFVQPPPPRAQPRGPTVTLPSTEAPAGAEKIMLELAGIRIEGATVYSADEFRTLYEDLVGRRVSLQAVYDLAKRITAKYGADGYVLSRAVVPPQSLNPRRAVIRIRVVEGYVDKVEWPASLKPYRDFFTYYAAKITADRPANIRTIERYLLLAGDLPGLTFTSTLRPSSGGTGAAVLVVKATEKRLDALARVDNRGTEARGPIQGLVSATVNNALRIHEAFTATAAVTSQVRELAYLAANYRQVLTGEGLTAFANASYGFGEPGTATLELLDYKTRSTVVEAGLSVPVVRSRERNVVLSGWAFASNSDSDALGTAFTRDRLRGVRAKAYADYADSLRGINQFSATLSQGIEGLGSTTNGDPLASRAAGRVDFTKIEFSAARLQLLTPNVSALVAAYAQYAFTSLLVPEQCGFGGRYFGRAFDPSQLLGDDCWEVSGELRFDLPPGPDKVSKVQLYGFADYGEVYTKSPAAFTPASADAASAGVGVRADWKNIVSADLSAAKAIEGPRDDWRFFFILAARH
jgi:hemolysin activation/secretion protein